MTETVQKQIDYIGAAIGRLEEMMIDPREFGRLEGAVIAMRAELDSLKLKQAQMDEKLDLVLDKLNEAKGGWRLLMALGGAGATFGAVLAWVAQNIIQIGPKP